MLILIFGIGTFLFKEELGYMVLKKIGFGIFLLVTFKVVFGQQDPQFNHYLFNSLFYNPGYTAMEGVARATLIHRSQWLGYSPTNEADKGGEPHTQTLGITYPLKINGSSIYNSGVGLSIVNDQLGPQRNFGMTGSFAYNIKLSTGGTLGAGLGVGFWSQRIDWSLFRPAEDGDALIDAGGNSTKSQFKPDVSLGLWYKTKKYEGGVSLRHLLPGSFDYGVDGNIDSKLVPHMYISGRYNIYTGTDLMISPNAQIYTDFSEVTWNLGALVSYRDMKYWGGLNLRQATSKTDGDDGFSIGQYDLIILLGVSLLKEKELRVGYSLGIVTSGGSAKAATSHELMLSYVLPVGKDDKKPPLRTPRYRHVN